MPAGASLRLLLIAGCLGLLWASPSLGQFIRDGSIGPGGVDDLGQEATYLIEEGLGERAGTNLFHSTIAAIRAG